MERVLAVLLTLVIYALSYGQDSLEFRNDNPYPPPMPVRTMGEWEEVQAVVITWTDVPEVLTDIVFEATKECRVIILTHNPAQVSNTLSDAGIQMDSIELIDQTFNDIWIRDYGPWTVYQNDVENLTIIDWVYNRLRPIDDTIPTTIATHLQVPIYQAILPPYYLIHAGGNHLQDGMGTLFTSDLILDENIKMETSDMDQIMQEFLGVQPERFYRLPKLPFDVIHHLDMHMRLIDEETIFIGEFPEGIADGPQIEDNIRYIKTQLTTPFGNPYRIIRLPMPPDSTGLYPDEGAHYHNYTNALFVNKTVLVPTYDLPYYDSIALATYSAELPGYNIKGINCNSIIPRVGAVHCITKLIGADDPLWIAHPRIRDTYETNIDYVVRARAKHRSGINQVWLHYRVFPEEEYTSMEMVEDAEHENAWIALIPEQAVGSEIQYYIEAMAFSGRTQVRPLVAPEGYFKFRVLDVEAPEANLIFDLKNTCPDQSIQFMDDSKGVVTSREWSFPGAIPNFSNFPEPTVFYPEPGLYSVSLTVANEQGSSTITKENIIEITDGVPPFSEDFTNGIDPSWTIIDHQEDGISWQLFDNGNCSGPCLYIDNWSNTTRNTNDYFQIKLDLSNYSAAKLDFDIAYAAYDLQNHDALRVSVITCDGIKHQVYGEESFYLATAGFSTQLFTPMDCSQWRHESVNLCEFAGETITLEFEHISRFDNFGNALYLDNIEVLDVCLTNSTDIPQPKVELSVWPNPAAEFIYFQIDQTVATTTTAHVILFNENGQMVHHQKVSNLEHQIAVHPLPPGMYFWVVQIADGKAQSGKIIIE